MKSVFFIMIFFMVNLICSAQEIISTTEGGDWNNPKTWVKGIIPEANSDVVICGNVTVTNPIVCNNIKVIKDGKLEFAETMNNLVAKVSGKINLEDCTFIIRENWSIFVKELNRIGDTKIENFGIITIGN